MKYAHCQRDPRECRPSYCSCQCDACFEAHYARSRTKEEKAEIAKLLAEVASRFG
jgi:hypothetical protein